MLIPFGFGRYKGEEQNNLKKNWEFYRGWEKDLPRRQRISHLLSREGKEGKGKRGKAKESFGGLYVDDFLFPIVDLIDNQEQHVL